MCPHCDNDSSRVVETRRHDGEVYRRRQCNECGANYFTRERIEAAGFPAEIKRQQIDRLRLFSFKKIITKVLTP